MAHQLKLDELDTDHETPSDVLSAYPNFTPGRSLLDPTSRRINTGWSDPNLKDVIGSRNEWSSAVGERNFINHELRDWNEVGKESFRSAESVRENNVDTVSFLSQPSELVDPPHELLYSANDDMENCRGGLSGEDVENELRVCSQVSSTSNANNEFVVVKCEKPKNPNYLLDGNTITTKNDMPVKFRLKSARAGQEVKITLRYDHPIKKDTPVIVCKEHRCDGQNDAKNSCTFWIPDKECRYEILNGHCTVFIPVTESSNCMDFCMVFKCLNSCHRNQSKKIDLLMAVVDPASQNFESRFDIRVCKNVKRDHKGRKRPSENALEERPRKSVMMFPVQEPGLSAQVKEENLRFSMDPFLMLLTREQQSIVLPLLKHMGIPVDPHDLDVCNLHPEHLILASDN